MPHDPRSGDARDHIAAIAARSAEETGRLADAMQRSCWPAGGDRLERGAVGWLKRWRPSRGGGAAPAVCRCRAGRCALCN